MDELHGRDKFAAAQAWQGVQQIVPFGKIDGGQQIDDSAGTPTLARNASVCRCLIREGVRRLINAAPNRQHSAGDIAGRQSPSVDIVPSVGS